MIRYILNKLHAYKEKGKRDEIARLREQFQLKEKNGVMWVMYSNTAIFKVESFANISEAVRILEETRDFAVEYAYGVRKDKPLIARDNATYEPSKNNPYYVKSGLTDPTL